MPENDLLDGEPRVVVTRGDRVECVHRVATCASDVRGNVLAAAGTIDVPIFLRSTAKPFIAAAAVAAGVRERFGLDDREIAVMASSHHGEAFHVAAVRSILQKIGLDESALQCGAHAPLDEASAQALRDRGEKPTVVHNNCSGKHAGVLAFCKAIGADTATYLDPRNPVQQRILAFCARQSGDDPRAWPIGIDGCGIPVYATSLRRAALAFARYATLEGIPPADAAALKVVRDATLAFPEYGGGTGGFDAELMHAGRGAIVCKGGAEGVHGVACLDAGIGYVGKVVDGASRARAPMTVAALAALGCLDPEQLTKLAPFARPVVYNHAGTAVGVIEAR